MALFSTEKPHTKLISGIPGFDALVDGGIPENSFIAVTGDSATGKTIFALQWLVSNAAAGEAGVYVTDENPNQIIAKMEGFGWNAKEMIKNKKLAVVSINENFSDVMNAIIGIGAKRLVLDTKQDINRFDKTAKKLKLTMLATAGSDVAGADGTINLSYIMKENMFLRALKIKKMADAVYDRNPHAFKISDKGIEVY